MKSFIKLLNNDGLEQFNIVFDEFIHFFIKF